MTYQPIGAFIIVFNKNNEVLLGKRLNCYKAGSYGFPGGRLELKESMNECAVRELAEETGLQANSLSYLGVIRTLQEEFNFIHFVYVCKNYNGILTLKEPDKCESWKWFSIRKLPEPLLPAHKAAAEMLDNPQKETFKDLLYN